MRQTGLKRRMGIRDDQGGGGFTNPSHGVMLIPYFSDYKVHLKSLNFLNNQL